MDELINLADFERAALKKLSPMAADYYQSGACDEVTLSANQRAYQEICLRYRVLVDVSHVDTSVTVLGQRLATPVMIAPTAFHKLACADGEVATAAAAKYQQTLMVVSTLSTTPIEAIVAATETPPWFQLYVYRDREATQALVARAEAAGCQALVLTVDAPVLGRRERDVRGEFRLPDGLQAANLTGGLGEVGHVYGESGLATHIATLHDASLSWKDLAWLQSITSLPIVLKGVVRADDARRAVDNGVSAIIVSNHGGRQLDTSVPTIRALPEVVSAIADEVEVYVDGGIRRGTDVVKALALGARAVLVGRPILWGLAVAGDDGASRVLSLLTKETSDAMALCGAPSVAELTPDLIAD